MPELSPSLAIVVLVAASIAVLLVGPRMVAVADRLADVTGLGEALVGAVFVGIATSIPDLLATLTPALRGLPDLASGNALGGVLGQTAFLAVIDLSYRRATLQHAAPSLPNIMQAGLLIMLLASVLLLFLLPTITVFNIHVGTFVLPVIYLYGMRVVREAGHTPMWQPKETEETRSDEADEPEKGGDTRRALGLRFAFYGTILALAGYALGYSGESLTESTGLSGTAVGLFLTGVSSSLSELVVGISAVRRGALTLAVGNVIGGNMFDILLVGVADVSYREGSVYAAAAEEQTLYVALAIAMTSVIFLGLLRRQRHGVANVSMDSIIVLALYALGVALVL